MNTVLRTAVFDRWLSRLKDLRGRARIIERIRSAERGHFGDCNSVGDGVSEMRIHFGPGYRLYFCRRVDAEIVLPFGGTKGTKRRDFVRARALASSILEV